MKLTTVPQAADWFKAALYGVLLFLVYHSALAFLVRAWQGEEFSYCWIVPPVVLYLIWEKRAELAARPTLPSWSGLVPLVLGIVLYWLGELGGEFTMLFLSLWLVIAGLCWIHLGWRKLTVISFPLLFGLGAFVPPNAIYAPLTLRLKLISSQLGVLLMQLSGLSAYREGNVIDLGFTQLQVVDACGGLRYVIPLFLMALLLAHYLKTAFWKRLLLVVSAIPVAILINGLRIASVGILYPYMGQAAAEGFFHEFSGWFIFMGGLGLLLVEFWVLKGARGRDADQEPVNGDREPITTNQQPRTGLFRPAQAMVALLLLCATLATSHLVNFRETTPIVRPLSGLPLELGSWKGNRTIMEQQFQDALKLSDYAQIDYRDPAGREVGLYVGFNASQSKGQATHSPASCLPGSGWVFRQSGTLALSTGSGDQTMRVSRADIEKSGVRQLVFFWFPQRGRVLTSLYQVKLWNFWDALTRQRTDGALVRVITPVYPAEQTAEAEQRLRDFTRILNPVLRGYLPN